MVVQADKTRVANMAKNGRDARSLSAVIEISFLTELNHAASAATQNVRLEILEGEKSCIENHLEWCCQRGEILYALL